MSILITMADKYSPMRGISTPLCSCRGMERRKRSRIEKGRMMQLPLNLQFEAHKQLNNI